MKSDLFEKCCKIYDEAFCPCKIKQEPLNRVIFPSFLPNEKKLNQKDIDEIYFSRDEMRQKVEKADLIVAELLDKENWSSEEERMQFIIKLFYRCI